MLRDKLSHLAVEVADEYNDRSTRHISMTTPKRTELLLVAILVQDIYLGDFIEFCLGRDTSLCLVSIWGVRAWGWVIVRHDVRVIVVIVSLERWLVRVSEKVSMYGVKK